MIRQPEKRNVFTQISLIRSGENSTSDAYFFQGGLPLPVCRSSEEAALAHSFTVGARVTKPERQSSEYDLGAAWRLSALVKAPWGNHQHLWTL